MSDSSTICALTLIDKKARIRINKFFILSDLEYKGKYFIPDHQILIVKKWEGLGRAFWAAN
jgi:hypothetical protein